MLISLRHLATEPLFAKMPFLLYKNSNKIEEKDMEEHKITKKDKLIYGITLAAIFFGVLGIGLVGLIINIFG